MFSLESEEYSEPEGVVVADVEGRSESDDEDESDFEENEAEERYIVPGKDQMGNKLDSYVGTDYSSKEQSLGQILEKYSQIL